MKAYQAEYPVAVMCRVLEVSPSGYYAWRRRAPSKRRQSDLLLGDKIEVFYRESDSIYGRPRIHADLREAGIFVSGKRVARLMRERNIHGISRRKWATTTIRNPNARPAPDLVDRKFVADSPNKLWVADITYIPTWAGFLYLAIVSMCSVDALSVGQWLITCAPSSSLTRSTWRSFGGSPPTLSIIPIREPNTPQLLSVSAAARAAFNHRWDP